VLQLLLLLLRMHLRRLARQTGLRRTLLERSRCTHRRRLEESSRWRPRCGVGRRLKSIRCCGRRRSEARWAACCRAADGALELRCTELSRRLLLMLLGRRDALLRTLRCELRRIVRRVHGVVLLHRRTMKPEPVE
jgi:hypothetical protein